MSSQDPKIRYVMGDCVETRYLFWLSWEQPGEDVRPITFPPNDAVLGWWTTGVYGDEEGSTLCAYVEAPSEDAAWDAIKKDWPDCGDRRFINRCECVRTSGRLPLKEWMRPRIDRWTNIQYFYSGQMQTW